MKDQIKIWTQRENKKSCFDFCSIADFGAREMGWKSCFFEDYNKIPYNRWNVLIGSVEQLQGYIELYGVSIPKVFDIFDFQPFLDRTVYVEDIQTFLQTNKTYPIFVKPYDKLKLFTGTILTNNFDAYLVLQNYRGQIAVHPYLNIVSEYRLYISHNKIIGLKHYEGDSLIFPDVKFINALFQFAVHHLKIPYNSYTLDIGVSLKDNEYRTFLIEANDGYAIGNYGLDPIDYVKFCKTRWLQIMKK